MTTDGNASSRFGVRGVEDLGGGMRAGFWLEASVQADDGNNVVPFQFRRRATVSLMGGFGEVRLGRDYTPTFWNWTVFDPFGTNGVGAATNLALATDQVAGSTFGTLVRANNTIGYFLPSMGGLYGQVMVAAGEGETGNKFFGGRLGYAAGPIDIAVSYGETEFTPAISFTNFNIAGSWNLGFMKLSGFYSQIEADANAFEQENWFIGASFPVGAWTFKGSYGSADRSYGPTSATQGFAKGTGEQIALGFTYDLSKRTALYGTYAQISNSDGARFRIYNGTNALAQAANKDSSGYQFGVRHSF
jgi:predicted porin